DIDTGAQRLNTYLSSTVELMQVLARACGHNDLGQIGLDDIATYHKDLAELTGINFSGSTAKSTR
ncbi:MAG: glutamate synthase, partial [Pseudomonadales bacterium]|nr:glutamate synthase [Pseudomonadales bacterium]